MFHDQLGALGFNGHAAATGRRHARTTFLKKR
jgi:hypothetical protein